MLQDFFGNEVPGIIELADSLPKSASGKILWRELQERENASHGCEIKLEAT
jgi:acyl-CoA synthetase (AMP-forming)/AMP-acid ligase II